MYIEEAKRNKRIQELEKQIQLLNKSKVMGPELIKDYEKKMMKDPANMEKYQLGINQIQYILLGYEKQMKQLLTELDNLMRTKVAK